MAYSSYFSNFSPLLFTRELRLMDVLDSLCQRMKLYQARAGPDFPYLKGGMGMCCCFVKDKGIIYLPLFKMFVRIKKNKKNLSPLLSKLNLTSFVH